MTIELPGFFDLQVNGFAGVDFNAPGPHGGSRQRSARAHARDRRDALPADAHHVVVRAVRGERARAGAVCRSGDRRHPHGGPVHLAEDGARGAHPREHVVPPTIDDFERRQDAAGGRIVLVTLAAEVPGALALIEHLVGVRRARRASATRRRRRSRSPTPIAAGATLATHLGNGCAQMLPRHPNVIWELLAADAVFASLIVDGHHLPPATVKAMVRAKDRARTILVTDAIAAAGMSAGTVYDWRRSTCALGDDGRVSLPGTPYLAGSSLTHGSRDREHRAVHRPADRGRDADGVDESRALPRHRRRPAR